MVSENFSVLQRYLPYLQFLMFGWGCVLWQAVALQWGRRPVYLLTLLGTMVQAEPRCHDEVAPSVADIHLERDALATTHLFKRRMGSNETHAGLFWRTN